MKPKLLILPLLIGMPLCGESKTETSLRLQIGDQDAQLAARSATIADLRAQLAAAHLQTATANGAATGSRIALTSRRTKDSEEVKSGSDSAANAARLSAELLELFKDQRTRSGYHSETMDKIDRQNVMTIRLLVLTASAIMIQFTVILFLFRRKT